MKNFLHKLVQASSFLAIALVALNVNSLCFITADQPKLPKGAERFRK